MPSFSSPQPIPLCASLEFVGPCQTGEFPAPGLANPCARGTAVAGWLMPGACDAAYLALAQNDVARAACERLSSHFPRFRFSLLTSDPISDPAVLRESYAAAGLRESVCIVVKEPPQCSSFDNKIDFWRGFCSAEHPLIAQKLEKFYAKALSRLAASLPAGSIALAIPPERLGPVPVEDSHEGWKNFAMAAKMLSERRLFAEAIACPPRERSPARAPKGL